MEKSDYIFEIRVINSERFLVEETWYDPSGQLQSKLEVYFTLPELFARIQNRVTNISEAKLPEVIYEN